MMMFKRRDYRAPEFGLPRLTAVGLSRNLVPFAKLPYGEVPCGDEKGDGQLFIDGRPPGPAVL
jgi:hypothetical protein